MAECNPGRMVWVFTSDSLGLFQTYRSEISPQIYILLLSLFQLSKFVWDLTVWGCPRIISKCIWSAFCSNARPIWIKAQPIWTLFEMTTLWLFYIKCTWLGFHRTFCCTWQAKYHHGPLRTSRKRDFEFDLDLWPLTLKQVNAPKMRC